MGDRVICPRCAAEVPDLARFCASCGAPVTDRPRAERRLVTVLFGDLSGFTALSESRDAEEVKALIDDTFAQIGEIVDRFGGHIDKVIGDEVMAVFGAPQAHEDDAARAVRAALAIQAELARRSEVLHARSVPLRMHVGINTGEVVAGFVGGSDAYTVLGDAVNTARRIQEIAAPGQILVGETTRHTTDHQISYRSLGRVPAKGKRAPVAVWEVLGERGLPGARARSDAPLIGREEELALLDTALDLVRRDQRSMLVTIVGEAGLGKTRLADEFAARAQARGVRVLTGRSLPYETASPTAAVEEMVRGALVMEAKFPEPEMARIWIRDRLQTLGVEGDPAHVLSFLGLGEGGSRGGHVALLETAWLLLEELARQEGALVLILHEMHWADEAVLGFARSLPSGRAPILAVCLGRPELLARIPDLPAKPGVMLLDLEPLPRARAEELLDLLAPGLHPAVRGSVLDRAGGNPFFIEELASLMVGRGAGETLQVPNSVQALVTARLDELSEREKRTLQDAAVVGTRFWPQALERLGAQDVAATLAGLQAAAWIEPESDPTVPGATEFRFRQAIVRDVAYASVPKQARAAQHAAVGAWLEEMTCACTLPEDFFDLVAHHFERAATLAAEVGTEVEGAAAKASEYLERAGAHALSLDSAGAAVDFLERALALPSDGKDELRRRVLLADALVGAARGDRAAAAVDEALALAEELGDDAARAKALRLRSDTLRMNARLADADAPLQEAVRLARAVGDEREIAEGMRSVGLLDMPRGDWTHAAETLTEAAERYRALGDPRGEAWCLANLGNALTYLRDLVSAEEHLTEAVRLFRARGDAEGIAYSLDSRALVRLLAGRPASALADVEGSKSPVFADRLGRRAATAQATDFSVAIRATAEALTGRLETALRHAPPLEDGQVVRDWAGRIGCSAIFLASYLLGDLATARLSVEVGRAAASLTDPLSSAIYDATTALIDLAEGDAASAMETVSRLVTSPRAQDAIVRFATATTLHALGRTDEALAHLEESLGTGSIGFISPAWNAALRAEMLAEIGDARAADAARAAADGAGEDAIARAIALRALARATTGTQEGEAALAEALLHAQGLEWPAERARLLAL